MRRRDGRAGSVLLSVLFWVAIVAAASGTGRLLTGVGWLVQLSIAVGLVLAVPAGARALRAHPVVPPVLATLTAVVVVTAMFVPARSLLFVIPTPSALADARALAQSGFTSIAQQGLPAVADDGIAFLLVGGVVVLAWATDLFAFSVRLPALAGLFPAALLAVPAVIDPADVSWPSLVLTALAYAAILAVSARPRRTGARRPSFPSAAPALAVVGVVVVAAGLLAGSASGYVRSSTSSGVSGTLFNGSIDPVVALGADLRRPDPVTVLRYATDSDLPVYLRVLTVSDFEGENWAPSATEETAPIDAPIAPEGLSESVPRLSEEVDVSVETLRSQWLPVPYPVESLSGVGDGWLQDVQDGSIRGDATTRAGDDYDVQALRLEPDPQQLLDAPAPAGLERYLSLPDDVPEIVRATAADVTADDTTAYDQARSLQSYFRSSEFTYSEDTPAEEGYDGDGVGVLEAFLTVREGYCVHFASAMAVMARELGIPSRLAIGYQPGSVVPSSDSDLTTYRVMSSDLHAWPELYFEGVGWLPFEPTPSRGAPASYTLPERDLLDGVEHAGCRGECGSGNDRRGQRGSDSERGDPDGHRRCAGRIGRDERARGDRLGAPPAGPAGAVAAAGRPAGAAPAIGGERIDGGGLDRAARERARPRDPGRVDRDSSLAGGPDRLVPRERRGAGGPEDPPPDPGAGAVRARRGRLRFVVGRVDPGGRRAPRRGRRPAPGVRRSAAALGVRPAAASDPRPMIAR
ncbi:DUF3488 and transglutaminase-like domain-containing protein [Rathayibacter oskolensis]|uniref:transglutaminase family protein n=1 Tax=Rathayibacter oskolensis TaxID=1891671 RepID=UPI00265F621D|nr:DUF3488 and transglutaminase-like domain-containing protein [Rathayibacter oskolensis]WKK71627.1 DUF3488 and transglutaminase-like domain-containing protein [Rathayibacter oskolensis]